MGARSVANGFLTEEPVHDARVDVAVHEARIAKLERLRLEMLDGRGRSAAALSMR